MESKYAVASKFTHKNAVYMQCNNGSNGKRKTVADDVEEDNSGKKLKLLEHKKRCKFNNQNQSNNANIVKYNQSNNNNNSSSSNHSKKDNAAKAVTLTLEEQRQALPIYSCRQRIVELLKNTDTMLIMGETGSGKTTQLPQYLYAAGYAKQGIIGITQPRRVAAITIAKRVAQEQGCQLGELVGYTVRFEDCSSNQTRIRYMTDGSLLREALHDRLLSNYSVLLLDEVHERTINSDVLMGIAKEAQRRRKAKSMTPLKLLVTSATMDIDNFSEYFGVPGMYLEGRMHDVRIFHAKEPQADYLSAALATILDVHCNLPLSHDVLIFLTGQEEIETLAQQIRQLAKEYVNLIGGMRVFPLYAQLPQHKQMECFLPAPANARKVILATNIAETSITIPGIRVVIDCGYVKRRIYVPASGLDVLRVVRISQAQAWQRSGRAGRDAPGITCRTYTVEEMEKFDEMPEPEILRSNISCIVLQLLSLGIDYRSFDFLDKPKPEAIENAYELLKTLGAIQRTANSEYELTVLGKRMVAFPLDPQYSKLLLTAPAFGCLEEMLSLVAMLVSENVFVSNTEKREMARLAHNKFNSAHGDHLTLLNVYKAFENVEKVKTWTHDNFLNLRNLSYAQDVRKQLAEIAERLNLKFKSCGSNDDKLRKCLLAGLCHNIAKLQRDNTYYTLSGRQTTRLHPSSVFHGKYKPKYIIYTDLVHTQRIFMRQVTEIQKQWIAEVVPNYPYLNRV